MGGITPRVQGQVFQEQTVLASNFAQTSSSVNSTITDIVKSATPHFSHTVTQSDLDYLELTGLSIDSFVILVTSRYSKIKVTTLSDLINIEVEINSISVFSDSLAIGDPAIFGRVYFEQGANAIAVGDIIEIFYWCTAGNDIFQYNESKIFFIPQIMTVTASMIHFEDAEQNISDSDFSQIDDFVFGSPASYSNRGTSFGVNLDTFTGGMWQHGQTFMQGMIFYNLNFFDADAGILGASSVNTQYRPEIDNLKFIKALL
jgi:hypothetical protein